MGKRLAIYSGLLGAGLALAALGLVKLGASLLVQPDGDRLWKEVTGKTNSAPGPRMGDGWINFERTTFVDTRGNFVSAGLVDVVPEPKQAVRQPITSKTHVGIMYKITVSGWQSILQGTEGPPLAVDIHVLRWVDVLHTGVDSPRR